ncbi:hypothetical protein FRC09_014695, partial [Ceratobasidium sp. 395]
MPRVSCRARTARRTLMMVDGQFKMFKEFNPLPDLVCPYCGRQYPITEERNRHIMANPDCRSHHLGTVPTTRRKKQAAQKAQEELEYKIAGPSNRPHPSQGGPAAASNGVNSANQHYNDPRRWTNNGRTCRQPFIDHFPISSAGQPISDEHAYQPDLKSYIESCGNLANPRNMEAAELLMTTGLSGKARTQHLQSLFYRHSCHDSQGCLCKHKGKVPWDNDGQMLTDIDNLPHGPDWFFQDLAIGEG